MRPIRRYILYGKVKSCTGHAMYVDATCTKSFHQTSLFMAWIGKWRETFRELFFNSISAWFDPWPWDYPQILIGWERPGMFHYALRWIMLAGQRWGWERRPCDIKEQGTLRDRGGPQFDCKVLWQQDGISGGRQTKAKVHNAISSFRLINSSQVLKINLQQQEWAPELCNILTWPKFPSNKVWKAEN